MLANVCVLVGARVRVILLNNYSKIIQLMCQVGALAARKDHWLTKGIVVKVMNKKLGDGKYYKAKGVVKEVVDRCVVLFSVSPLFCVNV